jgi:protein involved in polysaccharide export with SLBB domain
MSPKLFLVKIINLFLVLQISFIAVGQNTTPQVKESSPIEQNKKLSINENEAQPYSEVYRRFHENYKLGANDEIAIRILGQSEYSIEKTKISPVGRIYHPLLGDIEVAGKTVIQLTEELTKDLAEYLLNPKISISLLETRSAKVGVLGEVLRPGILIMNEPMRILDAIKEAGGLTEYGNKSSVIVYRQGKDGHIGTQEVNLKKILEGKSSNSENMELQPGDTVMVTGNLRKKVAFVASLTSIGSFMTYINRGR